MDPVEQAQATDDPTSSLDAFRKFREAGAVEAAPDPVVPEPTDAEKATLFSLDAFRKEQARGKEPVAVVPDEPVDEEVIREIDAMAPPIDAETPEQKVVRIKENRTRANKGLISRLANERDAARAEIARLKAAQPAISQPEVAAPAGAKPAAPSPAQPASVGDPRDPEPTYDSFAEAHPDHPDPYAGYLREQAKWDRRQEARQADQQRRTESATAAVQQATARYRERVETVRKAHPNYYDVVDPFVNAAKGHPYSAAVTETVLTDPEFGPLVLYRLATDREAARAVYNQPSERQALVQLGMIRASMSAMPAPKPVPVTPAALPPEPIKPVGGNAMPTTGDPTASLTAFRRSGLAFTNRR